ncbi:F-box only protein 25 [Fragariocoptes setiger]|uniref:F-box only protein 25 n=1 Tax=Fragariocoptes setiger TaxID=1670756 RepID=A0ABQ7S9W7_9ACAR|nr:F-box only protein 25 [Fragariocoptes setiger]
MPFIGRDWRSPGEVWLKTEGFGWQRAKIIESTYSYSSPRRFRETSNDDVEARVGSWPPKIIGSNHHHHYHHHHGHQRNEANNKTSDRCTSSWICGSPTTPSILIADDSDNSHCNESSHSVTPLSSTSSSSTSPSVTPDRQCVTQFGNMKRSSTTELALGAAASCTCCACSCRAASISAEPCFTDDCETAKIGEQAELLEHNGSYIDQSNRHSTLRSSNSCHNSLSVGACEPSLHSTTPITGHCLSPSSYCHTSRSMSCEPNHKRPLSPEFRHESTTPIMSITSDVNSSTTTKVSRLCCFQHECVLRPQAPHCQITLKSTREVANCNTISEAFYRLDFCNAIHDIRRFSYVSKLLHLLITTSLTSLSGCATKILLQCLEELAVQDCWGRPIGSTALWRQHMTTIERISNIASQINLSAPDNGGSQLKLTDLPTEMIREILLRLNDYRDLVNTARASSVFQSMLNSQHIWRQLCKYHFSKQQLRQALQNYYAQRNKNRDHLHSVCSPSTTSSSAKFARTVSADGRYTCRSPVIHQPSTSSGRVSSGNCRLFDRGDELSEDNEVVKLLRAPKTSRATRDPREIPVIYNSLNRNRDDASGNDPKYTPRHRFNKSALHARPSARPSSMDEGTHDRASSFQQYRSFFDRSDNIEQPSSSFQRSTEDVKDAQAAPIFEAPTLASPKAGFVSSAKSNRNTRGPLKQLNGNVSRQSHPTSMSGSSTSKTVDANEQIDWEQMFHQLRKKFGLKEEYPDCLLLCRHCRCLFWKSYGHPCIKENENVDDKRNDSTDRQAPARSITNENPSPARTPARVSVAALSRRFRANEVQIENGAANRVDRINNSNDNYRNVADRPSDRRDNNNQILLQQAPLDPGMLKQHRALGLDVDDDEQDGAQNVGPILPSHIMISPQAFLKFFSL